MVGEDPWLLLRLRGRDRQQVLASIHERRNMGAEPAARPSTPVPQPGAEGSASFYTPVPGGPGTMTDQAPVAGRPDRRLLGPAQGPGGDSPSPGTSGRRTGAAAPLGASHTDARRSRCLWPASDRLPSCYRARVGFGVRCRRRQQRHAVGRHGRERRTRVVLSAERCWVLLSCRAAYPRPILLARSRIIDHSNSPGAALAPHTNSRSFQVTYTSRWFCSIPRRIACATRSGGVTPIRLRLGRAAVCPVGCRWFCRWFCRFAK